MTDLRRLLWRWNAGLIDSQKLRECFSEEILLLLSLYRQEANDLNANSPEFQLRTVFDEAINLSQQCTRSSDFTAGFDCLKRARAAFEDLKLAIIARSHLADARQKCHILSQMAGLLPNQFLPTIESITRLLAKSEELFALNEARPARFVALMCSHEADNLLSIREPTSDVLTALRTQIQQLLTFAEDLSRLPWRPESLPIVSFVSQIERFIADGRVLLAERLLDDLELLLGPAVGFVAELARELGPIGRVETAFISNLLKRRGIDADDSWESATERLLEGSFGSATAKIAQIHETSAAATESTGRALAAVAANASSL